MLVYFYNHLKKNTIFFLFLFPCIFLFFYFWFQFKSSVNSPSWSKISSLLERLYQLQLEQDFRTIELIGWLAGYVRINLLGRNMQCSRHVFNSRDKGSTLFGHTSIICCLNWSELSRLQTGDGTWSLASIHVSPLESTNKTQKKTDHQICGDLSAGVAGKLSVVTDNGHRDSTLNFMSGFRLFRV